MWSFGLFGAAFAATEPAWQRVEPLDAVASTWLHSAWNPGDYNYHPRYVLDGDTATAWQEGASGDGAGESLTLVLAPVSGVTAVQLRVRAGYQRTEALRKANGAPSALRVTLFDAQGAARYTREWNLDDAQGWQELTLPVTVEGLAKVSLELLSVRTGRAYRDTAISDVELRVKSETRLDPVQTRARAEATAAWIAEHRVAAPVSSGPLDGARFAAVTETVSQSNPSPTGWAEAERWLDRALSEGRLERVESVRPTPSAPPAKREDYKRLFQMTDIYTSHGSWISSFAGPPTTLFELTPFLDLLRLADLSFSETPAELRSVTGATDGRYPWKMAESNAFVLRDGGGAVSALAWRTSVDEVYDYRMSMPMGADTHTGHLVRYEGGRATELFTRSAVDNGMWQAAQSLLTRLGYDPQGRLETVEDTLFMRGLEGEVFWYHGLFRRVEG